MAENPDDGLGAAEEGDGEGGAEEGAEGGGRGRKIALIIVTLLGLGAGGVVGSTTLGDSLGPILAEKAIASAEEGGGDGHDGGGEGGGAASMHLIDNLVVNPARSQGTRFLLTSIAVQANSPALVSTVSENDVRIRDALIIVLGAKTVEELTDITLRKGIAQELYDAVVQVVGPDIVRAIFIPQFVIQ